MKSNNFYWKSAAREFSRFLSMGDREKWSQTYGCYDRTYWSWKFTDFPGARYQESVYALGVLAERGGQTQDEKNYFEELWKSSLLYWTTIQHRDGSFDEAYPQEKSFAATAFTLFYIGQSIQERHNKLSKDRTNDVMRTIHKAADWLCMNQETHGVLSNHIAAGAAALETAYLLTQEKKYRERSEFFIQFILSKQSKEGWYEEYGGADPGYQTHTTFYLAQTWLTNRSPSLLESLNKSMVFLNCLISPTGSLGGICGSRNTEFFMPAGFEILAPYSAIAQEICRKMRPFFERDRTVGLSHMDPQNFLPFLNNYLYASKYMMVSNPIKEQVTEKAPQNLSSDILFPEAGIYIMNKRHYMVIVNLFKGGVVCAYFHDKKKRITPYVDGGLWVQLVNGKKYTSQVFNTHSLFKCKGEKVAIETKLGDFNQKMMTPFLFLGFRILTEMTFFSEKVNYAIKKILVLLLVSRKKLTHIRYKREIAFLENEILLTDHLSGIHPKKIKTIYWGGKFSSIHMGSSRYFSHEESQNKSDVKVITGSQILSFFKEGRSKIWNNT